MSDRQLQRTAAREYRKALQRIMRQPLPPIERPTLRWWYAAIMEYLTWWWALTNRPVNQPLVKWLVRRAVVTKA